MDVRKLNYGSVHVSLLLINEGFERLPNSGAPLYLTSKAINSICWVCQQIDYIDSIMCNKIPENGTDIANLLCIYRCKCRWTPVTIS